MRRLILPLLTTAIYLFLSYLLVVVRPIQGSLRNILIIALVASYVFGTRWLLKDAYPIIPQKYLVLIKIGLPIAIILPFIIMILFLFLSMLSDSGKG